MSPHAQSLSNLSGKSPHIGSLGAEDPEINQRQIDFPYLQRENLDLSLPSFDFDTPASKLVQGPPVILGSRKHRRHLSDLPHKSLEDPTNSIPCQYCPIQRDISQNPPGAIIGIGYHTQSQRALIPFDSLVQKRYDPGGTVNNDRQNAARQRV